MGGGLCGGGLRGGGLRGVLLRGEDVEHGAVGGFEVLPRDAAHVVGGDREVAIELDMYLPRRRVVAVQHRQRRA